MYYASKSSNASLVQFKIIFDNYAEESYIITYISQSSLIKCLDAKRGKFIYDFSFQQLLMSRRKTMN